MSAHATAPGAGHAAPVSLAPAPPKEGGGPSREGRPVGAGRADPLDREVPLETLADPLSPAGVFYRRSNLGVPRLDARGWTLSVEGAVARALTLRRSDLDALPRTSLAVTLECAGNGRALMVPRPPGTPWGLGAVSTAEFTGVPLRVLLEEARPAAGVREVLFEGADRGQGGASGAGPFARSLPLDVAMDGSALLAWEMDGRPLAPEHGHPLRLVVPGWYGMASVKWLVRIRLLTESFRGPFQGDRYVYRGERGTPDGTPVTRMRVRSVIASPGDGEVIPPGPLEIRGSAWSGSGPVRRVEVSTDGGESWRTASLRPQPSAFAAVPWTLRWHPPGPGEHLLIARASDAAGNVQPLAPRWNELGYGNNSVQRVRVSVAGPLPRGRRPSDSW